MGRALTSSKTVDRYSPISPKKTSWQPPMNVIATTIEAQPGLILEGMKKYAYIENKPYKMLITLKISPHITDNFSGTLEKETRPDLAKFNILDNEYFVVPAKRAGASNETNIVLKPAQAIKPLKNRSRSRSSFLNISTTFRESNRKSAAPGSIRVNEK
jgi:hypothetical protein